MIVLDTHALLWIDSNDRKLGRKTRSLLNRDWEHGHVAVSTIAFWEIGALEARKRVRLAKPLPLWREILLHAGLIEFPLTGDVVVRALELVQFHRDPADVFTFATALVHQATLITADERLLSWPHSLPRWDARL